MSADVRREVLALAAEAPTNPYAYPRTYIVRNGRSDGRVDLDPPVDASNLKSLAGVPIWTAPGLTVQAYPGDRVVVVFRDANPTRAVVIGFEPLTTGAHPRISLNASSLALCGATDALAIGAEVSSRRVVCYGDNISAPVSGAAVAGPVVQNPLTAPNAISRVRA